MLFPKTALRIPFKIYTTGLVLGLVILRLIDLQIPKPTYAKFYCAQGKNYEKQNNYPKAFESYKQAIFHAPLSALAYYRLALLYGELGNIPEKLTYFFHVTALAPDYGKLNTSKHVDGDLYPQEYSQAFYELGTHWMNKGNYSQALPFFLDAVNFYRGNSQARTDLGIIYYRMGNQTEANKHYKILYESKGKAAVRNLEELSSGRYPFTISK